MPSKGKSWLLDLRTRPAVPLLFVYLSLGLGVSHCQDRGLAPEPDLNPERLAPPRPAAQAETASVSDGRTLYQNHCTPCHALDHQDVGPAMLAIARKYSNQPRELAAYLKNPVKVDPELMAMPAPSLSEEDLGAVADYVLKLPAKAPDLLAPPSTRPAPKPAEAPSGGPAPEEEKDRP